MESQKENENIIGGNGKFGDGGGGTVGNRFALLVEVDNIDEIRLRNEAETSTKIQEIETHAGGSNMEVSVMEPLLLRATPKLFLKSLT